MKTSFKNSVLMVIGLVALVCAMTPVAAEELNIPTGLASVVDGTSNSTAGLAMELVPGKDYVFSPRLSAANIGNSNVTYKCNLRIGTNWTTTLPVSFSATANNTTNVVGYVVLSYTNFVGANALRLQQVITTQTNAVTTSGITADYVH